MEKHAAQLEVMLSCLNQINQQLDGFKNATLEMDKLADSGDADDFGVYVDMRDNHIRRIEQLDKQAKDIVAALPPELAAQVRLAVSEEAPNHFEQELLTKLHVADKSNRNLHSAIVKLDRALGEKIGSVPETENK